MTRFALLRRNLIFHRRGNVAVLLGVAIGTAVLTGALLVGDSLRGSLKDRAEEQRCGVDYAMVSPKFFVTASALWGFHQESGVLLRGSLYTGEEGDPRSLRNVNLLAGIDPGMLVPLRLPAARVRKMWTLRQGRAKNLAALSKSVADRLGVSIHETIKFRFPRIDQVAHESLLGQRGREKSEQVFEFLVDVIIPDDDPISQFRLVPGADTPRNVFVNFLVREEFGYKTNAVLVRGGDRTRRSGHRRGLEPSHEYERPHRSR